MVIATIFCMATTNVSAASWRMGNFDRNYNSGYTTVYLTNTKKTGKVKIHTYSCTRNHTSGSCQNSKETKAKVKVTYRTKYNVWISEFNTTSKSTLKLDKNNSVYKINIQVRQNLGSAANFTNLGKCKHWAIETVSNTNF